MDHDGEFSSTESNMLSHAIAGERCHCCHITARQQGVMTAPSDRDERRDRRLRMIEAPIVCTPVSRLWSKCSQQLANAPHSVGGTSASEDVWNHHNQPLALRRLGANFDSLKLVNRLDVRQVRLRDAKRSAYDRQVGAGYINIGQPDI